MSGFLLSLVRYYGPASDSSSLALPQLLIPTVQTSVSANTTARKRKISQQVCSVFKYFNGMNIRATFCWIIIFTVLRMQSVVCDQHLCLTSTVVKRMGENRLAECALCWQQCREYRAVPLKSRDPKPVRCEPSKDRVCYL